MAKKRKTKKAIKKAKKLAKKSPKLFITLVVLFVIIAIVFVILWKVGIISFGDKRKDSPVEATTNQVGETTTTTEDIEEKSYSFDSNLKYYKVEYDSINDEFIVKEESILEKESLYVIAKDVSGVVSLYILEDNHPKEVSIGILPSKVEKEYVWIFKETKDLKNEFLKYVGGIVEDICYDEFQIHFMMLGNDAAGDCTYIKAGDTDILIDAGSTKESYTTTSAYINKYCKDKKLEYVVATHGDADHIYAFPKFFQNYEVDTVIDFTSETYTQFQAFKNSGKSSRDYFAGTTKTTSAYGNYLNARDTYAKNHYTAGDCYLNLNGAKRTYQLSEHVTMDILYNYYYYDNDKNGRADSKDENNFSVLTLFTYNNNGSYHRFFLGGDLELEGEEKFAEYYDGSTNEKTMYSVDLYKAGHHGSKTSSNDCLLDVLQPKLCVACCCAGTDQYTANTDTQFPTQDFINRIAKWTDRVYAPTVCNFEIAVAKQAIDKNGNLKYDKYGNPESDKVGAKVGEEYMHSTGFRAMNGNIIVSSNGINIGLWASNNLIKLKDSEWFNQIITLNGIERKMRTWPTK